MELKNFRGTFKSWSDVPDLESVDRYKKVNGSSVPQIGDYIQILDAKGYPDRTLYSTEVLASDDSSIVGRMLAQDVNYISPNIPRGTVITYDDFLRLKSVEADLVFYKGLSWRFILNSSWNASELDSTQTYFVGDTVKFGDIYMRYNGLKNDPWEIVNYVPGKNQWIPLEEIDETYFSNYALENQVQSNTKNLRKALANKSNIFWGSMNLTDEAIQVIIPNSTYNARNVDNLSCFEGDTLWLNITNTTTGAFGQLYLTALEDCTPDKELVSTKVRSFVWSGVDGAVWFSGEGSPSDVTAPGAKVGDFYLDTVSGEVYSLERVDNEGHLENVWVYKSLIRGKDGDSLDSIVEYYLASDLDTGVTYDTPHWNDKGTNPGDIDYTVISFERPYLWNYEKITRTVDGTPTVTKTPPRIVGTYGGKGISSITDYYILTADENFVPSKTDDDWSTTPPVITPLLKCLWNYTRIDYTDNSYLESEITAIGRFGDKGDDGLSAFEIAVEHGYTGTESQWLNTLKGSDGDKWFNSDGVPSDSIGTDGDWCVDTSTGNVYHKVSGHWTSDGNIRGDDGDKWFNGEGAPTSSTPSGAVEGDYYLDTSTGDVYQKQSDNSWTRQGNIKGPAGKKGSDGISQYIFIMYSPDPSTDILHTKDERTDEDVWMGIAVVSEEASEEAEIPDAPTNPADYEWSKVVGENGSDAAQLNICGDWDGTTEWYYHNDEQIDVVYVDDTVYEPGTYACTQTHQPLGIFNPLYWTLMAADGSDGRNGESAVTLVLSNENCSVPSNADGTSPVLTNAKTTATLYVGGDAVIATYRVSNKSSEITLSQSGNEFTVTALEADTCFADIEATYNDKHYVKRFIITKQKKGVDGENAISYWIDKSTSIIKERINSSPLDFDPDEVVFTAMKQVGSDAPIRFTTGYLRLWKNGDSVEDDHGTGTLTVTATEGDNYYTVKLYENSETDPATDPVLDTETVQIIKDGNDGISQYIHIRYAPTDDTSLSDMSDTLRPTDKYLGMSVITSSTPPTRKIDYKWSYFVGEDGTNAVSFRNRGKWKANQTGNNKYVNNDEYIDVVYYETDENSYMCNETHESGATFDSSKWTVLAHKGATGGNGVSEYIHLRYSATDAPHNDMHTPMQSTDKYMGVAVNSDKNNPPASPSSYTWSSINAQDGQSVTFNPRDEWTAGAEYEAEDGIIDVVYVDSLGASFACKQSHTAGSNFVYDWKTMDYWGILNKNGISITGTSDEYAANNDDTTPPASDSSDWGTFAEAIEDVGPDCRFVWNREIVSYDRTTNPTETLTPHIVYRYTEDGENGRGILGIEESYAYGTYTAPNDSTWDTTVKTPSDATGYQYVWQRERVQYTDGWGDYSEPHILSMYLRGSDGKGISGIEYYYDTTQDQTAPNITEDNAHKSIPPMDADTHKYLWQKEVISYTSGDPKKTTALIGVYGANGTNGRGISSIVYTYKKTDSSTAPSDDSTGWSDPSDPIPTLDDDYPYLWKKEVITYSSGSPSSETKISLAAQKGSDGVNGKSAYQLAKEQDPTIGDIDEWLESLNGEDGDKWFNGTTAPDASTPGEIDDYYLNTSNGNIYKKTESGWGDPIGNIDGADGDKWFSGTGDPQSGGKVGDYYLDLSNGNVWHKTESGWGSEQVGNIKGNPGDPGEKGASAYLWSFKLSSQTYNRDLRSSDNNNINITTDISGYPDTPAWSATEGTLSSDNSILTIPHNNNYDEVTLTMDSSLDDKSYSLTLSVIDVTEYGHNYGLCETAPLSNPAPLYESGKPTDYYTNKTDGITYEYTGTWVECTDAMRLTQGLKLLIDAGVNLSSISNANSINFFKKILAEEIIANTIKAVSGFFDNITISGDSTIGGNSTVEGEIFNSVFKTATSNSGNVTYSTTIGTTNPGRSDSSVTAQGIYGAGVKNHINSRANSQLTGNNLSANLPTPIVYTASGNLLGNTSFNKVMRITSTSTSKTNLKTLSGSSYSTQETCSWTNSFPCTVDVYVAYTAKQVDYSNEYTNYVWVEKSSGTGTRTSKPSSYEGDYEPENWLDENDVGNTYFYNYNISETSGGLYTYDYTLYKCEAVTEDYSTTDSGEVVVTNNGTRIYPSSNKTVSVSPGTTISITLKAPSVPSGSWDVSQASAGAASVQWISNNNFSTGLLFFNNSSKAFYLSDLSSDVCTTACNLTINSTQWLNLPLSSAAWSYTSTYGELYKLVRFRWTNGPSSSMLVTNFSSASLSYRNMSGGSPSVGTIYSAQISPSSAVISRSASTTPITFNNSTFVSYVNMSLTIITMPVGVYSQNIVPWDKSNGIRNNTYSLGNDNAYWANGYITNLYSSLVKVGTGKLLGNVNGTTSAVDGEATNNGYKVWRAVFN